MSHPLHGRHIPALDGLRGLAVLMVFVFHFVQMAGVSGLLGRLAPLGQSGVDLFFVLSGFLITGILLDARGASHPLKVFYVRRALRIFPLYYFGLALYFLGGPMVGLQKWSDLGDAWYYLVYAQNIPFVDRSLSGPGHFWSLTVEEHFYLFWPFIVLRLTNSWVLRVAIGMIAFSILIRVVFVANELPVFYFTLCRLDGLAAGALAALAFRSPTASLRLRAWGYRLTAAAVILSPGFVKMSGSGVDWVQVVKPLFWAALYTGILSVVVTSNASEYTSRILVISPLRAIGRISYGVYVFHPAIIVLVGRQLPSPQAAWFIASFAVTIVVSLLSWHLYESPWLALKKRFGFAPRGPLSDQSNEYEIRPNNFGKS